MDTFESGLCPVCGQALRRDEVLALLPDKIGSWVVWHLGHRPTASGIAPIRSAPNMRSICGSAGFSICK